MHGTLPLEMINLMDLKELRLVKTGIGGRFPTEFGEAWPNIERLELGRNNFVGTVMTEFGYMTSLNFLGLDNNDFQGTIPTEFGFLVNMTRLQLQRTLMYGPVPTELGLMSNLKNLAMEGNAFTGQVPDEVCGLRQQKLDIFVASCPERDGGGFQCDIPQCCTFCRRNED